MLLIVDSRERAIIPILDTLMSSTDFKYQVEQISTGDYIIVKNSTILACIERKTYTDFAASFKDGRFENKHKMIEYREKTGCKLIYLLEGAAYPADTHMYARIPYKSILAAEDSLMFDNNIHCIHTKDGEHTVKRILDFMKLLSTRECEDGEATQCIAELKIKIEKPIEVLVKKCWASLPGISYNTADKISALCSFAKFYNETMFFTEFRASIINTLHSLKQNNKEMEIKILASIPGISKDTATKILENRTLKEFIDNPDENINISKTDGKQLRLGGAKTKKIIDILTADCTII